MSQTECIEIDGHIWAYVGEQYTSELRICLSCGLKQTRRWVDDKTQRLKIEKMEDKN